MAKLSPIISIFFKERHYFMNKSSLKSRFPHVHIGMRTVKTVVVVFLSLCLAYVRQGAANPLYIAISAILCIQPTMESSRKAGTDRLIGTIVGGFWGIIVFLLNIHILPDIHIIAKYAVISICLIPIIYTNIRIKRPAVISTSAVVYLIITASYSGTIANFQYVCNRLLDTFFGFLIAMAVNMVKLPSEEEMAAKQKAFLERINPPLNNKEEKVNESDSENNNSADSEKTDK